ncbi:MAG: zinc-dependent metalloprotease [Phycisphaerales bacterium]|nr:zinc-dependent metalloprotease [Phycisphaerales bacterium]
MSWSAMAQLDQAPNLPPEVLARMKAAAADKNGGDDKEEDFPPFDKVSKDYTKVVSTADGAESLYTVYVREKDGQVLIELPRNFERQNILMSMTVKAGSTWAGLQGADRYVKWERYDKRLALIEPELGTRSTGDAESKASVGRTFTDRVVLDVPIVTMGPGGGPVIDGDDLLVGDASEFFGRQAAQINTKLTKILKAKAFPENIELTFEAPSGDGRLTSYAYSIRLVPERTGYKPREADNRIGYFATFYRDLGKYNSEDKWVRYVNRWNLEKRDPSLKLSPPKQPIIFYIENTVPVRYRPYVRQGILSWNKAFENVGIRDAIEVYYQDAATGAHMDKDPEDSRYNFIVWVSNDISTAIGPSRANPVTGEILDADIVLTDGWLRVFRMQWEDIMTQVMMDGMGPNTLAWLDARPQWDPRLRLADPSKREQILRERAELRAAGHDCNDPFACVDTTLYGDDEFDGLVGSSPQFNGMCAAADGKAYSMAMLRGWMDLVDAFGPEGDGEGGEGGDKPKDDRELLDGVPAEFVGPLLADLVAHEVGHTLGLRHNFKASSVYTLDQINSEEFKGHKTFCTSVMDYTPLNVNLTGKGVQGDFAPIDIGPYDMWAIEYGYTFDKPEKVLERVAEPELVYGTDEDTIGPDPLAKRYDFSADPIEFCRQKMNLAKLYRDKLLTTYVKDGQSWAKARRGYLLSIREHAGAISIASDWVGGAYVNRDKKGDPNARPTVVPVSVEKQREALAFVLENAFRDEAFGLTPEMLQHMAIDSFFDPGGQAGDNPMWPLHERILGIQASALTQLINPDTLSNVYGNEFIVSADEDMLTLPELFESITAEVFSDLNGKAARQYTARKPMISNLRRNLQAEYVDRLIDLAEPGGMWGGAAKPCATIAMSTLREVKAKMDELLGGASAAKLDPYTSTHLSEQVAKVDRFLNAQYIYNTDDMGGGGMPFMLFFEQQGKATH